MDDQTRLSDRPRRAGTFTLRTLLLAVGSCGVAFGLLAWDTYRMAVVPLAIAIPVFWCGSLCMSLGSRYDYDYRALVLLGCVLMGGAVLIGVLGTLLIGLLWWYAGLLA